MDAPVFKESGEGSPDLYHTQFDLIVLGGGAAGIFAALAAKRFANTPLKIAVLEKTNTLLAKVKISGGGRCNVTHHCFDPKQLCSNYPRGKKELLGPFHRFQPQDTIDWFTARGVALKTEADGRIFPSSDSSDSIINCLLNESNKLHVPIYKQIKVEAIRKEDDQFCLEIKQGKTIRSTRLILATGSSKEGYLFAEGLGHQIDSPVPSLFTFNSPSSPLHELSGISVNPVRVGIENSLHTELGPLLITHFGFSGPAVLKLSAFLARELFNRNYKTRCWIDWIPSYTKEASFTRLMEEKRTSPRNSLTAKNPFNLPKNLWRFFTKHLPSTLNDVKTQQLYLLNERLHHDLYEIDGKTVHKEEFVTCGGVSLKEVNFTTMQSRICQGLYCAGEILNIDGITGGFNFQNAWTTGFLAGKAASTPN